MLIDWDKATERSAAFIQYMRTYHPHLDPLLLIPAESRGYWEVPGGCPGGEQCRHAFRAALGPCQGGTAMSVSFFEHGRDDRGRFVRPYREWERQRAASPASDTTKGTT